MWPFKKHDCRQGHRMRLERRSGISKSGALPIHGALGGAGRGGDGRDHFRCVADDVRQERQVCRDCGATWGWKTTYSNCLQSISMSSASHHTLNTTGFIAD